jgi:hypothetical protein
MPGCFYFYRKERIFMIEGLKTIRKEALRSNSKLARRFKD